MSDVLNGAVVAPGFLGMFSIYDRKAEKFSPPFFVGDSGSAIRNFEVMVNREDKENFLYIYPGDFQLMMIGVFDVATGSVFCHARALSLAHGDVVRSAVSNASKLKEV